MVGIGFQTLSSKEVGFKIRWHVGTWVLDAHEGEREVEAAEAGSEESSLCLDAHQQWSSSDEAQNQAWGDEDKPSPRR